MKLKKKTTRDSICSLCFFGSNSVGQQKVIYFYFMLITTTLKLFISKRIKHYLCALFISKRKKKKKNRSTSKGDGDEETNLRKGDRSVETILHEHQSAHANQNNQSISFHETVKFGSAAQKFR